ncbi:unnamed protein product [Polarella glacialis]|uniref:Uncharacterized protein n=1 Tax=Polarella glacialis TaxID=89957 RepID=A0A813IC74_POLGL|nr:unnamed protein product [Polarella glacialis]
MTHVLTFKKTALSPKQLRTAVALSVKKKPAALMRDRTVKFICGGQTCESTFGVLKDQLRRTSRRQPKTDITAQVSQLSALRLVEAPGLQTVLEAPGSSYRKHCAKTVVNPTLAFVHTDWMYF